MVDFDFLAFDFWLEKAKPLSALYLGLIVLNFVGVVVRHRHKVKAVGVALFFHVLEQLNKVSLFVGGDPSASG